MIQFKTSDEFLALNVGVELDEGSPFPLAIFPMFYQDKAVWRKLMQTIDNTNGTASQGIKID